MGQILRAAALRPAGLGSPPQIESVGSDQTCWFFAEVLPELINAVDLGQERCMSCRTSARARLSDDWKILLIIKS